MYLKISIGGSFHQIRASSSMHNLGMYSESSSDHEGTQYKTITSYRHLTWGWSFGFVPQNADQPGSREQKSSTFEFLDLKMDWIRAIPPFKQKEH